MNNLRWVSRILIIVGLVVSPFSAFPVEEASAQGPMNRGYFTNLPLTTQKFNVLNNGIPNNVTKAQLISFIETLHRNSRPQSNPSMAQDYVGTSYVIQTMRGGTDRSFPSDADIADWKARVSSPNITTQWGSYRASINSARLNYGPPNRDAARYDGDGINYRSMLFYNNGTLVYVLKQICANPLGGLPGIPELPSENEYGLYPKVNFNDGSQQRTASEGNEVTVDGLVANVGPDDSPAETENFIPYTLYRYKTQAGQTGINPNSGVFNRTQTINAGGINTTTRYAQVPFGTLAADGCIWLRATFPSSGAECEITEYSGQRQFYANNSRNNLPSSIIDTTGSDVGDTICYFMAIRRYDASKNYANRNDPVRRVAQPVCVTIAKSPKVQIKGGDLVVGKSSDSSSNITTSTERKGIGSAARTYGSWSEYGIIASGSVTGMASASGYSAGARSTDFCRVSLLTFSNAAANVCTTTTAKGGYDVLPPLPDISARFTNTRQLSSRTVDTNDLSGTYTVSGGTVRLNSGVPIQEKWIVINAPTSTVTIQEDILYTTGNITSLEDIPQVVIIANRIDIADSVRQVDAWLIANGEDGVINTCSSVTNPASRTNPLDAQRCTSPLIVNGPVVAKELLLYRTAGSDAGTRSGDPAEVFNLRPDAYLWATNYQSSNWRVQTVNTKELPPRF